MKAAVDIVSSSPHPTNKIAATIANNQGFSSNQVNHWPKSIEDLVGCETYIGNSSGTIHAETACLFAANKGGHKTQGVSIFITDPPCPNCMKNLAEAQISKLYIDHKGFDKDWAKRRGDHFENMSMRIAQRAGMDVLVIYRKEQRFEIISRHAPGYTPAIENPPIIEKTSAAFEDLIIQAQKRNHDEPFALALAKDLKGQRVLIEAACHPTIGYTSQTLEHPDNKYSFILQPINRLLMNAARKGLKIESKYVYSSRVPTSRELVNMIGAGLMQIQIGNLDKSRDEHGLRALELLKNKQIITIANAKK